MRLLDRNPRSKPEARELVLRLIRRGACCPMCGRAFVRRELDVRRWGISHREPGTNYTHAVDFVRHYDRRGRAIDFEGRQACLPLERDAILERLAAA